MSKSGKKILWMSRHNPCSSQLNELRRIFGRDLQLDLNAARYDIADDIARLYREGSYDDIVLVAPLGIYDRITQLGIYPLKSILDLCSQVDADLEYCGRYLEFVKFIRVREVVVIQEEVT